MERVSAAVHKVDAGLPITSLGPLRDTILEELSQDRMLARLSALVALLAVLLALTGVISVVSQQVAERTRDFGVRTALGATRIDIVRLVLRGVVTRAAVGLGLGLGLYSGLSHWLRSNLFEIGALDPLR